MYTIEATRDFALSLPGVEEQDHRGRPSFRAHDRIFATLWPDERRVVVKLTQADQEALAQIAPHAFEAVPGAFGEQGWTTVHLDFAREEDVEQALRVAHSLVYAKPRGKRKQSRR